jgi:hypothetical protein
MPTIGWPGKSTVVLLGKTTPERSSALCDGVYAVLITLSDDAHLAANPLTGSDILHPLPRAFGQRLL